MRFIFCLILVFQTILLLSLAVKAGQISKSSWTGYLIDLPCLQTMRNTSAPGDYAHKHPRACALRVQTEVPAYVLYADNKYFFLDSNGNRLARQAIEKSIKSNGCFVLVEGVMRGDRIIVQRLVELVDYPSYVRSNSNR